MQAKVEQAWEADKLAKRQARTPEVAVQSALSALQSRKAAMAKSQTKISELDAAAKQTAKAVEEAKQKAAKLQGEPSPRKGADTHKPAFRVAKTVVACASLVKQAARWAAEAHVLLRCSETTGKATASKTQAQEAGKRGAGFRSGVRLAFPHRSHTSRKTALAQRAQLAIGTSL